MRESPLNAFRRTISFSYFDFIGIAYAISYSLPPPLSGRPPLLFSTIISPLVHLLLILPSPYILESSHLSLIQHSYLHLYLIPPSQPLSIPPSLPLSFPLYCDSLKEQMTSIATSLNERNKVSTLIIIAAIDQSNHVQHRDVHPTSSSC